MNQTNYLEKSFREEIEKLTNRSFDYYKTKLALKPEKRDVLKLYLIKAMAKENYLDRFISFKDSKELLEIFSSLKMLRYENKSDLLKLSFSNHIETYRNLNNEDKKLFIKIIESSRTPIELEATNLIKDNKIRDFVKNLSNHTKLNYLNTILANLFKDFQNNSRETVRFVEELNYLLEKDYNQIAKLLENFDLNYRKIYILANTFKNELLELDKYNRYLTLLSMGRVKNNLNLESAVKYISDLGVNKETILKNLDYLSNIDNPNLIYQELNTVQNQSKDQLYLEVLRKYEKTTLKYDYERN